MGLFIYCKAKVVACWTGLKGFSWVIIIVYAFCLFVSGFLLVSVPSFCEKTEVQAICGWWSVHSGRGCFGKVSGQ